MLSDCENCGYLQDEVEYWKGIVDDLKWEIKQLERELENAEEARCW